MQVLISCQWEQKMGRVFLGAKPITYFPLFYDWNQNFQVLCTQFYYFPLVIGPVKREGKVTWTKKKEVVNDLPIQLYESFSLYQLKCLVVLRGGTD